MGTVPEQREVMFFTFQFRFFGTKQISEWVQQILDCKDDLIELYFGACDINTDLFTIIHHYQQIDPIMQQKRFSLIFHSCDFVSTQIFNMMTNVEQLTIGNGCETWKRPNSHLLSVFQNMIRTNAASIQSLRVMSDYEPSLWEEIIRVRELRRFVANLSCKPYIQAIVENNPWMTECYIPLFEDIDKIIHMRNIKNDFNKNPSDTVLQYNTDIRWIRFVLCFMRLAHEMQHAHSHSIFDILSLNLFPLVSAFRPLWWKDEMCLPLLQSFLSV